MNDKEKINELKDLIEWLKWESNIYKKMEQLLVKAQTIDSIQGKDSLDEWLKEQDSELYNIHKDVTINRLALSLNKDATPVQREIESVMNYFVKCNEKEKIMPKAIEDFIAKNIASYLQSKDDKRSVMLGQAFGLEKMKGRPKRSNRLSPEVIGITKELIGNELELTLAIEAYQEIQMKDSLDEETSTETLRTMFHEQKEQALLDYLYESSKHDDSNISDEARKLVSKYWSAEQDPLKTGTNRKKS